MEVAALIVMAALVVAGCLGMIAASFTLAWRNHRKR
jgi:Flp pilus assembly protein CpaB